ncbi:hypothetical protein [Lactococcus lactis]
MIKFKAFDVNGCDYEEQMEQFQTEFPQAEFLQITGGHMSPERIWFKYEPSDNSSTTDKLSVEKLQEQLNSKVKALTEIRANIEEHNQIYDLSTDTALLLEGIDGIAFDALAAIGGDDE